MQGNNQAPRLVRLVRPEPTPYQRDQVIPHTTQSEQEIGSASREQALQAVRQGWKKYDRPGLWFEKPIDAPGKPWKAFWPCSTTQNKDDPDSERCRKCTKDAGATVTPCTGLCEVCLQQCGIHTKEPCLYTCSTRDGGIKYEAREPCSVCQDPRCTDLPGQCRCRKDISIEMRRSAKPPYKLVRSAKYRDPTSNTWRRCTLKWSDGARVRQDRFGGSSANAGTNMHRARSARPGRNARVNAIETGKISPGKEEPGEWHESDEYSEEEPLDDEASQSGATPPSASQTQADL